MMSNLLLALGVYVFLFTLLLTSIKIGFYFGKSKRTSQTVQTNLGIVKVAEGTVFALLGLLIAFSFSGAYDRFEMRKIKIIDEINAIKMVYHRIDLLKTSDQSSMREMIKRYVDNRIVTYNNLAEFHGFALESAVSNDIQDLVWQTAVKAVDAAKNTASTLLFIQAINSMFEIGNTRMMLTRVHPPIAIFILLIGLGALSAFLTGYNMAKNQVYSGVYTFCFVAITAFTLYVIIDLEFPRIGMIRLDTFNYLLYEARQGLK